MAEDFRQMHDSDRLGSRLPQRFDIRLIHLIWFAMSLKELGADALTQAIAARRAGVGRDNLQAVVGLAFLLHGLRVANLGEELLSALAD